MWPPASSSPRTPLHARDAAPDQQRAHGLAGAEDAVLDGAERQARDLGDLVVAEVVRVAQDDQLAVGGRQLLHDRLDLGAALAALALLLGAGRGARQRALEGAAALALGAEVFGAGAPGAAQVVDG